MKAKTALLSNLVWFNKAELMPYWDQITDKLTSKSKYDEGGENEDSSDIITWVDKGELIGLPVRYGLLAAKAIGATIIDRTTPGLSTIFPNLPTPRTPKQGQFFDTLLDQATTLASTLAVAPTGTGKTVAALNTIARIGATAIVIVPSKNLAQQWKAEAMRHLGLQESAIHIFEGGDCQWNGFSLVIAVIHNLCNRDWPDQFYKYFGVAVWDEAHRVGAKVFSQSLQKFHAKHRIALTATPERKDGRTSILNQYFGKPNKSVKGNKMKALPCTVYVVNTDCRVMARSWGTKMMQMGGLISDVTSDEDRNFLIASIIKEGYEAGRKVLCISDRIDQLKFIRVALEVDDVPKKTIGMFIGSASKERLARIKKDCQVIMATYGMMKEGQDIPPLDMGIDASPRSDGVQAIGRIRRECPGKKHPIWVTLYDSNASGMLKGISTARIKDYKSCDAEVINIGKNLNLIPY